MSGADAWTILVTALDKTAVPFRQIRQNAERMTEPFAGFGRMLTDIGEQSGLAALGEQAEGLERHFSGVADAFGALSGSLGMLGGALSVGGLIELSKHAADYGEDLYEASKKTGEAVDQLARLHYVAEQSGSSAEQLDKALEYLNYNIGQAASGHNKEALQIFRAMHIAIRDSHGQLRTAAALWGQLSDAFARNNNMAQKTMAARALMGRAGQEMIPVLELGAEKTAALSDEFDRFHGRMTAAAAAADHAAHTSWHDLAVAAEGLGDAIGEQLTPTLMPVVEGLSDLASRHRELVAAFSGVALGVAGVALAAKPAMALFGLMGSGLSTLGTLAVAVVTPLAEFTEALTLGFGAMDALNLAFAASPFGVFVIGATAVAAVGYEIYEHWKPLADFFRGLAAEMTDLAKRMGLVDDAAQRMHAVATRAPAKIPAGSWMNDFYDAPGKWMPSLFAENTHWRAQDPFRARAGEGDLFGWLRHTAALGASLRTGAPGAWPGGGDLARPILAPAPAAALEQPTLHVQVDFNNLPPGVRLRADSSGPIDHEINVMNTGAAWNPGY